MLSPVATGSETPTLLQAGKSGTEVAALQMLRAYWDEAGSNNIKLWFLEQSAGHRHVAELTEETDVDAANTTRYLRVYPDHATPASIEDQRLRLERMRLQLRREILVETKDPSDDDFDTDWRIRIWLDGRALADQPEFGWDESAKSWYVKGEDNSDVLIHGTGIVEKTRIESGETQIFGAVNYDRAFATAPRCIATVLGTVPGMQINVGQVYAYPAAGLTLTRMSFEVAAQNGQTFADGEHVHLSWMAIGEDTD
jgi:hypothetical protein